LTTIRLTKGLYFCIKVSLQQYRKPEQRITPLGGSAANLGSALLRVPHRFKELKEIVDPRHFQRVVDPLIHAH
jgi:hypothetical protein